MGQISGERESELPACTPGRVLQRVEMDGSRMGCIQSLTSPEGFAIEPPSFFSATHYEKFQGLLVRIEIVDPNLTE